MPKLKYELVNCALRVHGIIATSALATLAAAEGTTECQKRMPDGSEKNVRVLNIAIRIAEAVAARGDAVYKTGSHVLLTMCASFLGVDPSIIAEKVKTVSRRPAKSPAAKPVTADAPRPAPPAVVTPPTTQPKPKPEPKPEAKPVVAAPPTPPTPVPAPPTPPTPAPAPPVAEPVTDAASVRPPINGPSQVWRLWSVCRSLLDDIMLGDTADVVTKRGTFVIPAFYLAAADKLSEAGTDVMSMSREAMYAHVGSLAPDDAFFEPPVKPPVVVEAPVVVEVVEPPVAVVEAPVAAVVEAPVVVEVVEDAPVAVPENPPVSTLVKDVRNLKFTLPIFTLLVSALQIAAHDRTEDAEQRRVALDKLCNDYKAHAGL